MRSYNKAATPQGAGMSDSDWMDGEVENYEPSRMNAAQEWRLLNMTKLLREDMALIETVLEIKRAFLSQEDHEIQYAKGLWDELTEEEQVGLWVAPLYGGIFTTAERKMIKETT